MVIYLIVNRGKKFIWLDVAGVKDPLAYIKAKKLCPALVAELDEPIVSPLATPKSLTAAEDMYLRYKRLLNPQYNEQ
jgi:hypothetical protein